MTDGNGDAYQTGRSRSGKGRADRAVAEREERKQEAGERRGHSILEIGAIGGRLEAGIVRNVGEGPQWQIPTSPALLDPLLMQTAIRLDLLSEAPTLGYSVPRQGRVKRYRVERLGMATIEFEQRPRRVSKIRRSDDTRDQTWIYSAPDLEQLPVRVVKERSRGVDSEMTLRRVEFEEPARPSRALDRCPK